MLIWPSVRFWFWGRRFWFWGLIIKSLKTLRMNLARIDLLWVFGNVALYFVLDMVMLWVFGHVALKITGVNLHPKTLFEIAMVLSTNSCSFLSNSHVSVTFSILLRFGNPGIRQILRESMLTSRWWEGRILINLCGNNNVRNCDLLQSDFFDRCRTVLGVAKGFFWYVVKLGKRWGPETLWFFTLEKHATRSHLPKLIFWAGQSDTSGFKKGNTHPTIPL